MIDPESFKVSWKAMQRDWLVARLRELRDKWRDESKDGSFCADPDHNHTARGRTAGCSAELSDVLRELE